MDAGILYYNERICVQEVGDHKKDILYDCHYIPISCHKTYATNVLFCVFLYVGRWTLVNIRLLVVYEKKNQGMLRTSMRFCWVQHYVSQKRLQMELRIEGSITKRERLESSRPRDSAMEFGFGLGPGSNHGLRAPFHRLRDLRAVTGSTTAEIGGPTT